MDTDICRNRHRDSPTSLAAFRGSQSEHARQRAWILRMAARAGQYGVTTDELSVLASESTGKEVPPNRISGRLSELKDAGLLVATNRRRPTRTGKSAMVLCVPAGLRPGDQLSVVGGQPGEPRRESGRQESFDFDC